MCRSVLFSAAVLRSSLSSQLINCDDCHGGGVSQVHASPTFLLRHKLVGRSVRAVASSRTAPQVQRAVAELLAAPADSNQDIHHSVAYRFAHAPWRRLAPATQLLPALQAGLPVGSTLLHRFLRVQPGAADEQAQLAAAAATALGAAALRVAATIFCRGREGVCRPPILSVSDEAERAVAETVEGDGGSPTMAGLRLEALRRLNLAKLLNHRLAAFAPSVLSEPELIHRVQAELYPPLVEAMRLPSGAEAALQAVLDRAVKPPNRSTGFSVDKAVRAYFGIDWAPQHMWGHHDDSPTVLPVPFYPARLRLAALEERIEIEHTNRTYDDSDDAHHGWGGIGTDDDY